MFQHTAARRRLRNAVIQVVLLPMFQHTAARRRLPIHQFFNWAITCFNTQPPEGGCPRFKRILNVNGQVSTHSRPKAAASNLSMVGDDYNKFQHTAARRRLLLNLYHLNLICLFQHTAARRRLLDNSYQTELLS